VSAQQQADFLTASYDTYAANGNVAAAFWFTYQDFPNGRYGLYDAGGLAPANRRADYASFTAAVAKYAPALAARFGASDVPASMAPGETRTITLAVHNGGGSSWSEADKERLGAAPGCPSAAVTNAFLFVPGGAGYANSIDDARITLSASVAPGADATLSFAITAPANAGDYVLGARMVREGVGWFGDTFRATIHVTPDGSGGGTPGDGNGDTTGGGTGSGGGNDPGGPGPHHGCSLTSGVAARSTGGGATFPMVALVCALAFFRRGRKPLV
jgi:hypothetical protein